MVYILLFDLCLLIAVLYASFDFCPWDFNSHIAVFCLNEIVKADHTAELCILIVIFYYLRNCRYSAIFNLTHKRILCSFYQPKNAKNKRKSLSLPVDCGSGHIHFDFIKNTLFYNWPIACRAKASQRSFSVCPLCPLIHFHSI